MRESVAAVLEVIERYRNFYGKPPAEIFAAPSTVKSVADDRGMTVTEVSGVKLTASAICPQGTFYAFNEEDAEQVRQQEAAVIKEILERPGLGERLGKEPA